jgi:hypothetical protein
MSEISTEQMTRLKGQFSAKYGIEMDDWSAMVMTEISQRFMFLTSEVNRSVIQIDEAAKNIKGKVNQINFRNNSEAIRFGIGLSLPFAAMGTLISGMVLWYSTTTREYVVRKQIIEDFKNAPSYAKLMKNGKIIEREGHQYLVMGKADQKSGDVFIGQEYIEDGNLGRILIPLGKK